MRFVQLVAMGSQSSASAMYGAPIEKKFAALRSSKSLASAGDRARLIDRKYSPRFHVFWPLRPGALVHGLPPMP